MSKFAQSAGFLRIVRSNRGTGLSAGAAILGLCALALPAAAADWPQVKSLATVPACVTPGRLMAMVKSRNGDLDARFETIASEYLRQGEAMGRPSRLAVDALDAQRARGLRP